MMITSLQDRLGHFTDETRAFFRLLRQSGDVCEIRAPDCPHKPGGDFRSTHSGYFRAARKALEEVEWLTTRRPRGIYVTLNPVRPALLARSANKITSKAEHTTADEDIVRRDWLFLDIDSERPTGVSATDEELEAALDLAEHIRTDLAAEGWPDAVLCMSGNGAYLLYRIELPNDEWATDLVKRTVQGLAHRYDTDAAEIDRKTYNASRIIKVMGTWARKG
ncbi:MAG: hypothetical protein R6U98_27195, partial [Pirellulaceae bacterium]